MDLSDRELLARTLVAEAGLEGPQGMLAAGSVIMNRAAGGGYGDGVRGVILKPGQFSAWNGITGYAGGKGANDIVNRAPTDQAYQIADTLLGGSYDDPTGGATHYYAPKYADPAWGMRAGGDWAKIGGHVFGKADAGRGSYTAPRRSPQGGGTMREPMTQQRQPMVSTQGAEPERKGLFNPDVRDRLIVALEGMTLNPNQALMGQASQAISDRKKDRRQDAATNRTAAFLEAQGRSDLAEAVRSGILGGGDAAGILFAPEKERGQVVTAEQLRTQFPGAKIEDGLYNLKADGTANKIGGGGTTVNVGAEGGIVAPPKDMIYATDADGRVLYEDVAIGGGKTARRPVTVPLGGTKAEETARDVSRQKTNAVSHADQLLATIDSTLNDPALGSATGGDGWLSAIPGTGAKRAATKIEQLKGQVFLQAYEQLKGGGVITEIEGKKAEAAIARLDRGQSDEDFKEALMELREIVLIARERAGASKSPAKPAATKRLKYNPATGDFE
jgi:hypothetical protein